MTTTRYRVERSLKIALRPSADCNAEGCDWTHPESQYTRDAAKEHVRDSGHPVIIKTETLEEWEPA